MTVYIDCILYTVLYVILLDFLYLAIILTNFCFNNNASTYAYFTIILFYHIVRSAHESLLGVKDPNNILL